VSAEGKLGCGHVEAIAEDLPQTRLETLPRDAVIVQLTQPNATTETAAAAAATAAAGGSPDQAQATDHYLVLLLTGQV
jgi:uncharacterized membrane protein